MIRRFCGRREGAKSRPVHLRSLRLRQIKHREPIRSTSIPCRWPMVSSRQMTRFCASARPPMPFHTPGARRSDRREVPWEASASEAAVSPRCRWQSKRANDWSCSKGYCQVFREGGCGSEQSEAQSNCGIDVVALKIAVSQSAIHFREHQPGVEIPLRGKLPIDNAGDRVKRTGALRVLAAGAGQRPRGGGAVVRILGVMVIGCDHIELLGERVFHPGPHDLKNLVAKTVAPKGCVDDVAVVDRCTVFADKVSRDVRESGLRVAWRHVRNSFVARVDLEPLNGVFGE